MRRLVLSAIVLLICFGQSQAQMLMLGFGSGCTVVTYAASPLYQNLTFSGWSPTNTTMSGNAVFSPACATTGTKDTPNSTSSVTHDLVVNTSVVTAVQTYTAVFYAKRVVGTLNVQAIIFSSDFGSSISIGVDLSNCTINVAVGGGGSFTSRSGSVSVAQNGWCRIQLSYTGKVDTNTIPDILPASGTSATYTGNSSDAIGIWGFDLR